MATITELYRNDDWKTEKHVPVIELISEPSPGEMLELSVSVGREVAHPNTTAHHIRWIRVYFLPTGEKTPYEIGSFEFNAHGASVDGADASTIYTDHRVTFRFKSEKSGAVIATSFCNIHGLWESSMDLKMG